MDRRVKYRIKLEIRAKQLKTKLSVLGSAVAEGKYWLTIRNNGIKAKRMKLYQLKQERNRFDIHILLNYSIPEVAENAIAISNLEKELEWDKQSLKEGSADQKKLIISMKETNRELSNIEKKIEKISKVW